MRGEDIVVAALLDTSGLMLLIDGNMKNTEEKLIPENRLKALKLGR